MPYTIKGVHDRNLKVSDGDSCRFTYDVQFKDGKNHDYISSWNGFEDSFRCGGYYNEF